MSQSLTILEEWAGLSDFSVRVLGVVEKELSAIRDMQADMASTISGNVRQIAAGDDGSNVRDRVAAVVTATQIEDHLRQRHEHISAALAVLSAALGDQEKRTRELAESGSTDIEIRERLGHRVIEGQTLSEVRAAFSEALGLAAEQCTPVQDGDSGEVDLF